MAFVYILQSQKNDSFYIGSTINLAIRLKEHQLDKSTYTKNILPVTLVFNQEYDNVKKARQIEYWLKKQKDKSFIKKIVSEGKINKTL